MNQRSLTEREMATYAWLGLIAYIFTADVALMLNGKKTMTEVWEEALRHPVRRWVVFLAWGFTTKHLLFREVYPWLDPYSAIAGGAVVIQKLTRAGAISDNRHPIIESINLGSAAIASGLGDEASNPQRRKGRRFSRINHSISLGDSRLRSWRSARSGRRLSGSA